MKENLQNKFAIDLNNFNKLSNTTTTAALSPTILASQPTTTTTTAAVTIATNTNNQNTPPSHQINLLNIENKINLLTNKNQEDEDENYIMSNTRSLFDFDRAKKNIFDNVYNSLKEFQIKNDRYTLKLSDLEWMDPEYYTVKDRKEKLLAGQTLARRLRGKWQLYDNATNQLVEERKQIVASVPYLTELGTFVFRGNEYVLVNQQRLKPGVYVRKKTNGDVEAHVNILPGQGVSHHYTLDPDRGVFKIKVGQAEIPLYPLLKAIGAKDEEIKKVWGDELFAANYGINEIPILNKLKTKFLPRQFANETNTNVIKQKLAETFANMKLDPKVMNYTLRKPYDHLSKDVILDATSKLIKVLKNEDEPDDRDHIAFSYFCGPEELFRERIDRDFKKKQKELLKKINSKQSLKVIPSGFFTSQLEATLLRSGLGQPLEEINPAEILDRATRITRSGEGGIPGPEAIAEESRNVHGSHLGFLDPVRVPENQNVGTDLQFARNVRKDINGNVYSKFKDARTGKEVWKNPVDLFDKNVVTSDVLEWDSEFVPAFNRGKIHYVKKSEIDYILPSFEDAFSPLGNLVALKSASKPGRLAMGSRYISQAIPLVNSEAPLVQGIPSKDSQDSFEKHYSRYLGAVHAEKDGMVVDVKPDEITVKYVDGTTKTFPLYNNYPFNRETYIHNEPLVKVGETFKANQLLAKSNYTDRNGQIAIGTNLRTAYIPWRNLNFKDAVVISESAAKKLTAEQMFNETLVSTENHKFGKKFYLSLFPQKYGKEQLEKLDDNGIIKVGQKVEYGQPLILACKQNELTYNKVHKKNQAGFKDDTVVWKYSDPGIVTDVAWSKDGPIVFVKTYTTPQVGDKLSGRYGDKGVIAAIIPDDQMPRDQEGKPFELLLSPLGIISRTNPAQVIEGWLGKVARKTGKPVYVSDFDTQKDLVAWTRELLKQHNLSDVEDVIDPITNRKITGVNTGERFIMRLYHRAESKAQGRSSGAYTSENTPAKGGESGSKRISIMDINALLSHGAVENLKDINLIRGQKNEDYWLNFMRGYDPPPPNVPFVYEKFINQLKAAGINVQRQGHKLNLLALTDKEIDKLAEGRIIRNGGTVNFDDKLNPIKGGLFDPSLTGGHNGKLWSAIELPVPMLNPIMEEPTRKLLNLTEKEFQEIMKGNKDLGNFGTGPQAIQKALSKIDIDSEIEKLRQRIHGGASGRNRDSVVEQLALLKTAKRLGVHPKEWFISKVPVIPPVFRPISYMESSGGGGIPIVNDLNYHYKLLMHSIENFNEVKSTVGEENAKEELYEIYNTFKGLTGLTDPVHPKFVEKNIKGVLKTIFGNSPKFSVLQRKLLSSTVDNVGRGVIVPDPDLDMDQVALPKDNAFDIYAKFIVRRLVRRGLPVSEALKHVKNKTDLALKVLIEEMEERPVYVNRAPTLHKFNILAMKPILTNDKAIHVNPFVLKGFNADFDGDTMQFHVPSTKEAVKEALERMLPSKNLFSIRDFTTPAHMPVEEDELAGLYLATRKKKTGRVHVFSTKREAIAAWKRGDIGINDEVRIISS